jgi:SAM-dependent methyltransferase
LFRGAAFEIYMSESLDQHRAEIERNLEAWERKPLSREVYRGFYDEIPKQIDLTIRGRIVEIGSGMGNLRKSVRGAITTDLFPAPWNDVVCDAYELPFKSGSLSHLILFDVFHHLEAPVAFLNEAQRTLAPNGRVIIFDPYISLASKPAYGFFHHEEIGWRAGINFSAQLSPPRKYYAAQGNATRLFFRDRTWLPQGWTVLAARRFAAFSYLLSGGFSKRQLYPARLLPLLRLFDRAFSMVPQPFAARCLIVLRREPIRGH